MKLLKDKKLFWESDLSTLNPEKHKQYIIERVFERGDVEDIRQCRRYYGDEKIREILTTAKWLSKQTVYLAAAVLDNELSDYRCYITAQSNPELWSY